MSCLKNTAVIGHCLKLLRMSSSHLLTSSASPQFSSPHGRYYRTLSPSHTLQTPLCSQCDHEMFQMFQFAVKKSWCCQLLRKRMIHIAGSQPNYVTEPSRAAEAMCTVTSRECLDLLKRESFPVLMHNPMMIDLGFRSRSSLHWKPLWWRMFVGLQQQLPHSCLLCTSPFRQPRIRRRRITQRKILRPKLSVRYYISTWLMEE